MSFIKNSQNKYVELKHFLSDSCQRQSEMTNQEAKNIRRAFNNTPNPFKFNRFKYGRGQ